MHLIKTAEGQQAFKERHADLGQRLRSAFLLFDGNRSLLQVLEATSAMGISKDKPELSKQVNEALKEIKADGTYAKIYKKWFGEEPKQ